MPRVLLVDDDQGLLLLMREYLESFGFDCETANTAVQARKFLGNSRYDIVVSDLDMPGETGWDLFQYVSAWRPDSHFVLMTGFLDSQMKRDCLKMGIADYLEKPFRLSNLMRILNRHLLPCTRNGPMEAKKEERIGGGINWPRRG